jgi:acetyl-CoA acetyltransferase
VISDGRTTLSPSCEQRGSRDPERVRQKGVSVVTFDRAPAVAVSVDLPPKRYPEATSTDLQSRVIERVLDCGDLAPAAVDGLFVAPAGMAAGREVSFTHNSLYDEFGFQPSVANSMHAGGATYSFMLHRAARLVSAGDATAVLCLGAGKFPDEQAGRTVMANIASHDEFEFPYGVSIPALYALTASRYMAEYEATPADLARVAVSGREWAQLHPEAYMGGNDPLTVADVLDSPVICDPLHRLHCSVPVEGGGGFLVTTGERAREITDQPAYVLGTGECNTHKYVTWAPSLTTTGARESGRAAFEQAKMDPAAVDVVELYDAFASTPLVLLEDLGFADPGTAASLFEAGSTAPGGGLPVNTNGGLLSYGHAGDSSGASVLNEAVSQTMGTAGDRLVEDCDVALAHTYSGVLSQHATTLLGRKPA